MQLPLTVMLNYGALKWSIVVTYFMTSLYFCGVLALKVLMLDEGLHCVNVIANTLYMWFTNEILFWQFLIYSAFKYFCTDIFIVVKPLHATYLKLITCINLLLIQLLCSNIIQLLYTLTIY